MQIPLVGWERAPVCNGHAHDHIGIAVAAAAGSENIGKDRAGTVLGVGGEDVGVFVEDGLSQAVAGFVDGRRRRDVRGVDRQGRAGEDRGVRVMHVPAVVVEDDRLLAGCPAENRREDSVRVLARIHQVGDLRGKRLLVDVDEVRAFRALEPAWLASC